MPMDGAMAKPGKKQRSMLMTIPHARRTSPTHEVKSLLDGRKRQKLSHSPEKQFDPTDRIADDAAQMVQSQDSGSSDQSASKWFREANNNLTPAQLHKSELDGTFCNQKPNPNLHC